MESAVSDPLDLEPLTVDHHMSEPKAVIIVSSCTFGRDGSSDGQRITNSLDCSDSGTGWLRGSHTLAESIPQCSAEV